MKIFSGSATAQLTESIARELKIKPGVCELSRFPNGENRVWIKEDCVRETVFILQSFSESVDESIMQFCFMVDAIKRLKPKKIIGVIPWFGYAKQNRVFRKGETLAAEVVARLVSGSGIDEAILLDVHSENVKNFFTVPVTELSARELFIQEILSNTNQYYPTRFDRPPRLDEAGEARQVLTNPPSLKATDGHSTNQKNNIQLQTTDYKLQTNIVVVSPDAGAVFRNQYVAEKLGLPLFVIDKKRDLSNGEVTINGIKQVQNPYSSTILQFHNSTVFMFDDMILSGGTVAKDVDFLKSQGADDIYFFATHYCPTKDTCANLRKAKAKKIIVTNSLAFDIPDDLNHILLRIDLSRLFAEKMLSLDK